MARITRHIRHMHHVPCIECGIIHNNPASSVRCDVCGNAKHSIELINKAVAKEAQRLEDEAKKADEHRNDLHIIAQLRGNCSMSMTESANFLKAFRICMENING